MTDQKIVIENPESTVIARYEATDRKNTQYQSEADLEKDFIEQLQAQAYEYLPQLHTEHELIDNLRLQMERLNAIRFTKEEWQRFYTTIIAKQSDGIVEKTRLIQEDNVQTFTFDKGEQRNLKIFDQKNVHNNSLQVINQYSDQRNPDNEPTATHRYDVTILVNGLPLVHVELKRRGVPIREAFNQINRYQRDSFWSGTGLFEYVQIFVISNGTQTKYYSNTTRHAHVEKSTPKKGQHQQTSNSFEFTSWWADEENHPITDLTDFTRTFFAKHTLLNILAKYCIFTSDSMLMVMRPYQICATEKIMNRIAIAHNYHKDGSIQAGGYIWHTTGSGKTLTSFKTARLATQLDYIDKVVFVVDRKDLDYQTMKEYDHFERGAANSNSSSVELRHQLASNDPQKKLVITTIQKLSAMLKVLKDDKHSDEVKDIVKGITGKSIVFIFDECHRSQFGEMHRAITKRFQHYYIFGFTGTPIFAENAGSALLTTAQAFGDQLHSYTIVDAIRDMNVLPFRVEYVSTIKEKRNIENTTVESIDTENALKDPRRIQLVTEYIIKHFNQKTKRNEGGFLFKRIANVDAIATARQRNEVKEEKVTEKITGFNSIFAVSSIAYAKLYYNEFKQQQSELRVATIFSYGVNEAGDSNTGVRDENNENTDGLTTEDRDFLEGAIKDYNDLFGTSYDTSAAKFPNYYKDVSLRMKNREIDILIVVNMFLTGFDATTLNTLWVDKNLKMHGLLQAYSRTNRILNSIKTFGNIVCFRNLEQATNDAIALFGNKEASGLVLLKTYEDYYYGYDENGEHIRGYKELVEELMSKFKPNTPIASEQEQKDFVRLFGALLRMLNILQAFDQFDEKARLITVRDMQDYQGMYNDIHDTMHGKVQNKEEIKDDLVFEMELIKQVEINIDYILELVKKYQQQNSEDHKVTLHDIDRAIKASPQMRDKKDLIDAFVKTMTPTSKVNDDWNTFVRKQMKKEIDDIIGSENLQPAPAKKYIEACFVNGYVEQNGTDIAAIMPPLNPFDRSAGRDEKKRLIIDRITALFNKYYDLVDHEDITRTPRFSYLTLQDDSLGSVAEGSSEEEKAYREK